MVGVFVGGEVIVNAGVVVIVGVGVCVMVGVLVWVGVCVTVGVAVLSGGAFPLHPAGPDRTRRQVNISRSLAGVRCMAVPRSQLVSWDG
jgi:hypothetical protein